MKEFPTLFHFCWVAVFGVKGRLGGDGGIGREEVEVRERWRVGWIEETERKTMGCGLKDGSDLNHVSFLSPTTCSLLCIWHFDKTCLSDHCTKTKTCYVQIVTAMCGYSV